MPNSMIMGGLLPMPQDVSPDFPYLDLHRLQQFRVALPEKTYRNLCETFLTKLEVMAQALTSLSQNDAQDLANILHQLKGSAANFGAIAIWHYSEQFEQKRVTQDWPKNAQNIQELLKLCAQTKVKLHAVLHHEKTGQNTQHNF